MSDVRRDFRHSLSFDYRDGDDGEAIDMAFNKKRADDRKEWINGYLGAHWVRAWSIGTIVSYADGDCVDHSKASLRCSWCCLGSLIVC